MDDLKDALTAANATFLAGMSANESITVRRLDNLLKDVDEAIYQISRMMADNAALNAIVGHLQRSCSRARGPR